MGGGESLASALIPIAGMYFRPPRADPEQIWHYTYETWDGDQAEKYVREIQRESSESLTIQ